MCRSNDANVCVVVRKTKRIRIKNYTTAYKSHLNRRVHLKRPKKTGRKTGYRSNGNLKGRGSVWFRYPRLLTCHKPKFAAAESKGPDAIEMERPTRIVFDTTTIAKWRVQSQSPTWLTSHNFYIDQSFCRRKVERGQETVFLSGIRWQRLQKAKRKARLPLQCWGLHKFDMNTRRGIIS